MVKLRVPSLQHLARNWRENPESVKIEYIRLAANAPTFNYNPLFSAASDILQFNIGENDLIKGLSKTRREDVRNNYLSIFPLLFEHLQSIKPSFVNSVDRRFYPVDRDLMVPFSPPVIYGLRGKIHFPWFSFWKSNPLADQGLSLFASLVDDVLSQDPDLEAAEFHILDFSAPSRTSDRTLSIIEAREIPRVTHSEKVEMLSIFAEGFRMARVELAKAKTDSNQSEKRENDSRQIELFSRLD